MKIRKRARDSVSFFELKTRGQSAPTPSPLQTRLISLFQSLKGIFTVCKVNYLELRSDGGGGEGEWVGKKESTALRQAGTFANGFKASSSTSIFRFITFHFYFIFRQRSHPRSSSPQDQTLIPIAPVESRHRRHERSPFTFRRVFVPFLWRIFLGCTRYTAGKVGRNFGYEGGYFSFNSGGQTERNTRCNLIKKQYSYLMYPVKLEEKSRTNRRRVCVVIRQKNKTGKFWAN